MKKRTIIALIVAVLLIFAGGIILTLGLSFAGEPEKESKLIQQDIAVPGTFDSIFIDTQDCNVNFAMFSGRDDCMVTFRTHERINHSVTVDNGVLKIKMQDERKWSDYVSIFPVFGRTESMGMTVYLPAAEYESLQVRTDTGDITLTQEPFFREALLRSDTGDISCVMGVSGDLLDCMTSTGDITVQNSAPGGVKLQSNTGNLEVSAVAGDEIHLKTDTGDVDAENVNAEMFTCSSNTGEVELERVLAEDYLQIRTTTGDVDLENCDAGRVDIETDTGDVEGHFLTSKWFSAHSNTGNVRVPNTPEGGECRIETDTGDIRFE